MSCCLKVHHLRHEEVFIACLSLKILRLSGLGNNSLKAGVCVNKTVGVGLSVGNTVGSTPLFVLPPLFDNRAGKLVPLSYTPVDSKTLSEYLSAIGLSHVSVRL